MSIPAVGAFWDGEASPGRLVDGSGNSHDLTLPGSDPGNPSTPTVPFGSKWLFGGHTIGTNYLLFPSDTITNFALKHVWEFWARIDSGNGITIYYDDGVVFDAILFDGNADPAQIKYWSNSGVDRFNTTFTRGENHRFRIVVPANGGSDGEVWIDKIQVVSGWSRVWTGGTPTTHRFPNDHSSNGLWVDALMLAQGTSDAYPGVASAPTVYDLGDGGSSHRRRKR